MFPVYEGLGRNQAAGTCEERKPSRILAAAWRRQGEPCLGTVGTPMPRTTNNLVSSAHPCPHFAHTLPVIGVNWSDMRTMPEPLGALGKRRNNNDMKKPSAKGSSPSSPTFFFTLHLSPPHRLSELSPYSELLRSLVVWKLDISFIFESE